MWAALNATTQLSANGKEDEVDLGYADLASKVHLMSFTR